MTRTNWTRDELILTFNLYCKIPFGQCNKTNKHVISLANIINRTPSAIAFKLGNFASLDPYHKNRGVKGLTNSSKLDKEIYQEFSNNWEDLIYESESLLSEKSGQGDIQELFNKSLNLKHFKKGEEIKRIVKTRVNQQFFRKVILSIYSSKCAITNINIPEMLLASHIIPWSKNTKERLNPCNGICLSPMYDKAFDCGLMSLTDNNRVIFSSQLLSLPHKDSRDKFFMSFKDKKINLPEKFIPKKEFIEYHRNNIFQG